MNKHVLNALLESIVRGDIFILLVAILTVALVVAVWTLSKTMKMDLEESLKKKVTFSESRLKMTCRLYTVFVTMISVFPLLGMLGTVFGLLGLDLANGDMGNIRDNFFRALTSTAWGIIFAVIFKIVHACIADELELRIENYRKKTTESEPVTTETEPVKAETEPETVVMEQRPEKRDGERSKRNGEWSKRNGEWSKRNGKTE